MENYNIDSRYKIINKIGEGGSSIVYKCYDSLTNEYVAIKILKGFIKMDLTYEKNKYRLMKESHFIGSFNSKNIIKVKGCYFQDDRNAYIVLEYADGHTLKNYIKKNEIGQLEALYIIKEIINGLILIHEKNYIHRDIKPQNIIITNSKQVKLLDFGIMLEEKDSVHLTSDNKVVGSIQYMAPELLTTKNSFSKHSDIYSLGILLFEIITGQLPFQSSNIDIIAEKHTRHSIPNIQKYKRDLNKNIQKVINKACNKKPELRYKDLLEMKHDILAIYKKIKTQNSRNFV